MSVAESRGVVVSRATLWALGLLVFQLLVRLAIIPQSTWWEDDFLRLSDARERGLTGAYVFQDYNDHLEIVPNLLWWLLARVTDSSWAPAAAMLLLLSTAASTTFFLLLRELFGSRPATVVALAVYICSPLALISVTWLSAGLELMPMQIALFTTAWAMVRYLRTMRGRWLVVSLAAFAFGLLSCEKSALALPFTLGVWLLVVMRGADWSQRLRSLRQHWRAWSAHVVLLVAYLGLYSELIDGSERRSGAGGDFARAAMDSVFQVLIPGIVGAPWHTGNALNTLYPHSSPFVRIVLAVGLAAVAAVTIWRHGRAAVWPWLLALGYVAADVVLLLWGRAGYLDLVANDPRYVTDALPVVLIAGCAAFVGVGDRPSGARTAQDRSAVIPLTAGALLAAGGLLMTFQLLPVVDHSESGIYVARVMARADPDPGTSILDLPTPVAVSGAISHERLLLAMGRSATFDQPSAKLLRFDAEGRLVPVVLTRVTLDERGPVPGCGWPVDRSESTLATISSTTAGVVRLDVVTGLAGTLTLAADGETRSVDVPSGLSTAWFPVGPAKGSLVATFAAEDGTAAGACVAELVAGRP